MKTWSLIDSWRRDIRRLWSIRVALFWGAVCGAYGALPAFQDTVSPSLFAGFSVVMSMSIVAARITKQPGLDR